MNGYATLGRVITESHNDVLKFRYFYNAEGALTKKLDIRTGKAVNYEYDSLGRLIHSWQLDENGAIVQKGLSYRDINSTHTTTQVSQVRYSQDGNNALSPMTLGYSYDNLGNISAITGAISGAMNPTACFVAGTSVAVASGFVAIETLKEGDLVWAWDEQTGDVSLKQVVETYVNETDELVHVTVAGEEIVTTPAHPFYSPVKGWTDAVNLRAGDILVLVNGEYVVVEKVQHEILESPVNVYNFQVEDYHTYYVSDAGVLVHNSCDRGVGGKGWRGDKVWKENVQTVREGGTITDLKGLVPSQEEGANLIREAGGKILRIEGPHPAPNPHSYPHINYTVNGIKGTLRILEKLQ